MQKWLEKIQKQHVKEIDLGLERVKKVAERLAIHPHCPIITVAGTNGKGSCVAGLEAIYREAGYRSGVYTSPILFRHNEYVRLQGKEAEDAKFCEAFEKVEQARQEVPLTLFEFNTLAAFVMFEKADLDVWILEVGLGGRLDAVNVMDADAAIIASIDIDHADWLGNTREKIAIEKAGICRPGKPAICGDLNPPKTLAFFPFYYQGKDFGFEKKEKTWTFWSQTQRLEHLPLPTLALQNMATVLMTVECMQSSLPVTTEIISKAMQKVSLPGRIQVVEGDITQIFDVSHNPAAAAFLAEWLRLHPISGKTRAVFSMLADKDIVQTIKEIHQEIDEWHVAPLDVARGASLSVLADVFESCSIKIKKHPSITDAYQSALEQSQTGDRVVIFGSFHVISNFRTQLPF